MRAIISEVFTGLVQTSSAVAAVADGAGLRRLVVAMDLNDVKLGESIAINGVCLTVAAIESAGVAFDVIAETLSKTNLGSLRAGDLVHTERAMRVGDRFDGHFVQGHVDGTAKLLQQDINGSDWRLRIDAPPAIAKYLAPKGSITLDGVSLTIASLDSHCFEVALIPTTLAVTQLGRRAVGYAFNVECDMIGKTVVTYLETHAAAPRRE